MELTCMHCGKTINIPEGLEEFSCVYCGGKMTLEEISKPKLPLEQVQADAAYVEEHIGECISDYPDYYKHFTRKEFESSFSAYKLHVQPIFEAMNRVVMAQPLEREALLDRYAVLFLDKREEYHKQDKRWNSKHNRYQMMFDSKLTIAWFLVPAIYKMELPISEDFVRQLHTRYMERYPKNAFYPGTYTEISAGFKKRKFCFITTAVCEFEGKTDNCVELESFRRFRDEWLAKRPGGQALIEEYYDIAPMIVGTIDYCDDRREQYARIREGWLTPCYEALQKRQYCRCRRIYTRMVRALKRQYGLRA